MGGDRSLTMNAAITLEPPSPDTTGSETGIKVGFSANRAALPANARTDIAVDTRPRTRLSTSATLPDGLCGIDRILDFILASGARY